MVSKDKVIIIIAILGGLFVLVGMIGFIGQGNVRHVEIFWQEKVEQTVIFEEVDGKVQLRAILGVSGEPNPKLITRTGFAYVLTVINNGDKHHRLYIEGLDVQTKLLEPGQQEILTMYPPEPGIFKYYDKREQMELLGTTEVISVVQSDEFTGFLRDLI